MFNIAEKTCIMRSWNNSHLHFLRRFIREHHAANRTANHTAWKEVFVWCRLMLLFQKGSSNRKNIESKITNLVHSAASFVTLIFFKTQDLLWSMMFAPLWRPWRLCSCICKSQCNWSAYEYILELIPKSSSACCTHFRWQRAFFDGNPCHERTWAI